MWFLIATYSQCLCVTVTSYIAVTNITVTYYAQRYDRLHAILELKSVITFFDEKKKIALIHSLLIETMVFNKKRENDHLLLKCISDTVSEIHKIHKNYFLLMC